VKARPGGVLDFIDRHPDGPPADARIWCGGCGRFQAQEAFYLSNAYRLQRRGVRPTGSTLFCRSCAAAKARAYKAPKVAIIDAARLAGCTDCGLVLPEYPEVFDFDHVRGEKLADVGSLVNKGSIEDLRAEMEKCEVVCANCHRIRTRRRGAVTKGRDRPS
jgi:hypothetical protein